MKRLFAAKFFATFAFAFPATAQEGGFGSSAATGMPQVGLSPSLFVQNGLKTRDNTAGKDSSAASNAKSEAALVPTDASAISNNTVGHGNGSINPTSSTDGAIDTTGK